MIVVKMLIGLVATVAILSTIYAIGQITARVFKLSKLDTGESMLFGFMSIMAIGLGTMLSYLIGEEIMKFI
jgi:hypothetical protein